jgi:integrase
VPAFVTISKSLSPTRKGLQVKPTKTEQPRTLSLPATAVQALREHRILQQEMRQKFGSDYRTDLDLVFATPDGDYLKPDSVTAKVCLLARKIGMPGVSLHTLRHSHGSQLLSKGVPLTTVSKRLGHSGVRVTAEVYSHALGADELAAADIWDQSVGAAMTKVRDQTKQ